MQERRVGRTVTRIAATFEAPSVQARGYIKNVSKEGLFLRTNTLPATGDPVSIIFVDRLNRKVEIYGTVRWTTAELASEVDAKPGFGMCIDRPGPEFLEFYEELLTG